MAGVQAAPDDRWAAGTSGNRDARRSAGHLRRVRRTGAASPCAIGDCRDFEDIGVFCNRTGWTNVTCFVVSATTGECSDGFTKISSEDPGHARDAAWFAYAVYKTGILVDDN
jgi:hypothetical protein